MNEESVRSGLREVLHATKSLVTKAVEALTARVDALEKRAPMQGEKGDPGQDGKDGRNGADGKDGAPGENGKDGRDGQTGRDGIDGINGRDGEPGPKGDPGDKGADGKDGIDGEPGRDGADGINGKDGLPGDRGEPGEKGIDGRDGRDGQEGIPGRDALEIPILPAIDFERSYPRGTFAKHKAGLWRAAEKTNGERGWECVVCGFAGLELIQDGTEFRNLTLRATTSEETKDFQIRLESPAWHDGYKAGDECDRGDIVVFGGSAWIATQATKDVPGTGSQAWTILARRGKDGKDGDKGDRGEKGDVGRAGRDLTQLGPNGEKW